MSKKVIVLLAPGFEEIEAITAIDILRRADIDVTIAGIDKIKVSGSHHITVIADKSLAEITDDFDACILPGGMPGASNLFACAAVRSLVQRMFSNGKVIAAICASPAVVLAPLGILDGKKATCFAGMENAFPKSAHFSSNPVVVDCNLITSRGPGTALQFALTIVEQLSGQTVSEKLRKSTLVSETISS